MSHRPPRLSNKRLGYIFWWIATFFLFSAINSAGELDITTEGPESTRLATLASIFAFISVAFILSGTLLYISKPDFTPIEQNILVGNPTHQHPLIPDELAPGELHEDELDRNK